MKRFLFVCVAIAAVTLFSNSASAQVKIGYFDEQAALSLFPGIAKAKIKTQKWSLCCK